MKRLIVIYRTGDYEYHDQFFAIEYSSKDNFLLDLELNILNFHEIRDDINTKLNENTKKVYEKRNFKNKCFQKNYDDFLQHQTSLRKYLQLTVGDYILDDEPSNDLSIHDFTVLTLDEFFANNDHVPEKIEKE